MGGMSRAFSQGMQQDQQHQQRRQQLEDEKRKGLLKMLTDDAETPADKYAAYQAVYHQDPGVLKQHVENLTRRITGKQAQPVVKPEDAQAARLAPIAARGKTPERQAEEASQRERDATGKSKLNLDKQQTEQGQENIFGLIDKYITDPEQNKIAKEEYVRRQAGAKNSFKNLPGSAGQPYQTPTGSWVKPIQSEDGTITEQPMPARWKPPAPKPGSPAVQFTNLLAKKLLADRKQGPPLTNEEEAQLQASKSAMDEPGISRSEAWAAAAAKNNLIAVTDPTTGQDTLVPRAQAVAAAGKGTPYLAGVVSAPTGMDKKNQMLAQSALTQIDTMEKILDSDPGLTGPGAGQWTAFNRWLGSNSEDSQQFLAAATFMSEHGVGVFGGRNIHSIEDLQGLMGSLKTNPKALKAALEQARQTMQPWATAGGRLPAPKAAQGGGAHQYAIDDKGKRHKTLDPKAQLPQGWKWAD